jgi:hypothetical protein
MSADFQVMNAYVKQKRELALEQAREFFKKQKETILREKEEEEKRQREIWDRLQLCMFWFSVSEQTIIAPLVCIR